DARVHELEAVPPAVIAPMVAVESRALPRPRVLAGHVHEDVVRASRRTRGDSAEAACRLVPAEVLDLDRALRDMPARRQQLRLPGCGVQGEQRDAAGIHARAELGCDLAHE